MPLEGRHRTFALRRKDGQAVPQLGKMQRHLFQLRLPAAHGEIGE